MYGKEVEPIPVAVRYAFYGRVSFGIAGSSPAKDMEVLLLYLMCVV
jgi:hypothetical protein